MNQRLANLLNHNLFKKSIIYTVTDAVNKAIPFLILPFLTYYLSPSDYGVVSNYTIYISVLVIFVGLNSNGALAASFYRLPKEHISIYVFNMFLLVGMATGLFLGVSFLAGKLIMEFLTVPLFFILLAVILASSQCLSAINLDLWRMEEKPGLFGIYQISQTVVNILLTIALVIVYRLGWKGRLWALAITNLSFALVSFYILYQRGYLRTIFNADYIRDALKFGLPLIPHSLGIWVRTGIDRVFITKFYGTAEAGLYSTGFQFGLLLSFIVMAFHNAYVPYLYRSLATKGEEVKGKLVKFTYAYFLVVLAVAILFSAISVFVINNFLSVHYKAASSYVWWAMLTQAFQGMYLMVSIYLFYAKRTVALAITTFTVSGLQAVLSYLLIRHFGAIGGAYSAFVMGLINFIALWIVSANVFPMPWLKFKKSIS